MAAKKKTAKKRAEKMRPSQLIAGWAEALSLLTREVRDLREQVTAVLANHAPAALGVVAIGDLAIDREALAERLKQANVENESLNRQVAGLRATHAEAFALIRQVAEGNGNPTDLSCMAMEFLAKERV